MQRNYNADLIKRMEENEKVEEYDGVKVLVKPIPEGGNPGDMDPRLYKSMKMMPIMSKFMPKQKKDATILEKIMPLRKMFGEYKGIEMVDSGIVTQNIIVKSADGYDVPVLIYKREKAGKNLPIMVYYHGGGFFGGGTHIVEQMCKLLVTEYDCIALNVDYRLCPENSYPAPFDDCWAATKWIYDHAKSLDGDPSKIAIGGDSAGGNLAAGIALKDRDENLGMVKLQVLLYPAVNISGKETEYYHGVDNSKYQMSKKHKRVLKCVIKMMQGMLGGGDDGNMLEELYLQGHGSADSIYVSPLLDDFHDLPATLLMFGEHDMLVFEDFAYAKSATVKGAKIKTVVFRGLGHGFADQIGVVPQAEEAIREIAKVMKEEFK